MKKFFLFSWFCIFFLSLKAQNSQWTWIDGDNIINKPGKYLKKGADDAGNNPGARYSSISWTDITGNFWLYGGYGFAANDTGHLNDLWKYNIVSNHWTWVNGSNDIGTGILGKYGIKGITGSNNTPGGRSGSVSWTDIKGSLWLFGGDGIYNGNAIRYNDLWKYDPLFDQWTWVSGDKSDAQSALYGILGIAASENKPGPRTQAVSWTDALGNFWMFGGNGTGENNATGLLNDLWKYDPLFNHWTWVSGDNTVNNFSTYGIKGIPGITNKPGGRSGSLSWTDAMGNLWLFGGIGFDESGSGYLNDLWKYDIKTNLWVWVSGDNVVNEAGVYGKKGKPDTGNKPGARSHGVSWVDASKNFWLFGGMTDPGSGYDFINDLWKYDIKNNVWSWESGDEVVNQPGIYGTRGKSSEHTNAGARVSPVAWQDLFGNLYLFGGTGYAADVNVYFNDMWKYSGDKSLDL